MTFSQNANATPTRLHLLEHKSNYQYHHSTMNGYILSFFAIVAVASAGLLPNEPVPILSQDLDVSFDGTFRNSYETGNGILVQEQGYHQPGANPEEGINVIQGSVQWTAPDGSRHSRGWTADQNGAQYQGSDLPEAPPVPPAIQRALEYIAAHPQENDGQVRPVGRRF
ncbi:endocuticle structural glycoprotein SgAbd-4-like [Diachasmimorpha longicaudata]|uniref:endocuticle structural glycoprotein SgAbd-4-like n=1 Tax=Diachasmimorpha longicaudata TaxID=58733 RepID=UPI0030B9102A